MGVRDLFRVGESARVAEARASAAAAENHVEVLSEAFVDLQRSMEDRGWKELSAQGEQSFTLEGLRTISRVNRVMLVANPLIKRGMAIRCSYIHGGNLQVAARGTGEGSAQDVNAVVQAYQDDPLNQAAFTGDEAQERLERALGTDGNVLLANFTRPLTGDVQTRTLPFDELQQIITNPEDSAEPWYYLRVWRQDTVVGGAVVTTERKALYPALFFRPAARPRSLVVQGYGAVEVMWDAPVRHVKVNDQEGWQCGVGDVYAAVSFARLYKEFLTDWATLVKSLSQFAWRLTRKGGGKADELRQKVARPVSSVGNPGGVGATAVSSEDVALEAIPKTGATVDSDSGKPMAAMVAAALGVPLTMLLADPGATGARAVAETLDTPTENEMGQRRTVWETARRDILNYVILQSIKAPQGLLKGTVTRDRFYDREVWELAGDPEAATIDFTWPELSKTDPAVLIKAIVEADATGKLPPLITLRLILAALKVDDIDEIIDEWTDEDGKWIDPGAEQAAAVAAAAVEAFRAGQDPALAMGGDPDEDDEPDEDEEDTA